MKILIISAQPPSPYSGGEIRLLNLIKPLAEKHEFTVIAPIHQPDKNTIDQANRYAQFIPILLPDDPPRHSRWYYRLNAWGEALVNPNPRKATEFYSPLILQAIERQLQSQTFNLVQVQQLTMAQYLPRRLSQPAVLDVDNLLTKLLPRHGRLSEPPSSKMLTIDQSIAEYNPSKKFTHRLQARLDNNKVPKYEKRMIRRFDACLAISHEDAAIIQRLARDRLTAVIPNGVDCTYFNNRYLQSDMVIENRSPVLLFIGTMSWEANADAAIFFSRYILPLVRQQVPNAQFVIAGRQPTPAVQKLAEELGITVTGFVEDIRPYLAECTVFVAPIRAGAGSRLKILETLAMGKAVVSTTIGAEGLQVTPGKDILIADDTDRFSRCILDLINQPGLRQSLAENGRKLVVDHYDWSSIAQRLDQVYQALNNIKHPFQ